MPVVPITKGRKGAGRPPTVPPAEPFALMAAAAMHQAGRLAPEAEGPQGVMASGKESA
jgi:hypothetical protein